MFGNENRENKDIHLAYADVQQHNFDTEDLGLGVPMSPGLYFGYSPTFCRVNGTIMPLPFWKDAEKRIQELAANM